MPQVNGAEIRRLPSRRSVLTSAGLGLALGAPAVVRAQGSFPTRPVRVICALGAGGTADVVARLLCSWMSQNTGQPFVVENRQGASGTIGASAVVHAPADGYTLLYDATPHSVNPALFGARLPYDTERDLAPVFLSMVAPNTINVHRDFEARTVRELIAMAKAAPDTLDGGTTGIGSAQHISLELFNKMTGVRIGHVTYRGTPAVRNDLLARRIALNFSNVPGSVPMLQIPEARVLCHAGVVPVEVLPGVEAIADTLPGYETYEWNGIFAPAGTSGEIIQFLNTAFNNAIQAPAVAERLRTLDAVTRANTPEECARFRHEQIALHGRIVREANIRIE
jgi:tripartite-type tricarboxylate transporter receptor subunit TctC